MVTQNMLRTHEGKWFFSDTNYLICDCSRSNQIAQIAPYVRTNFDKLQVHISTMIDMKYLLLYKTDYYKFLQTSRFNSISFSYFVYFFIPPSTYAPVTNHHHRSDSRYITPSRIMVKIMKWIFAKTRGKNL